MDSTIVLVISAALAAILHTLVPDHEIPLALIGRAQNWTLESLRRSAESWSRIPPIRF